MSTLFEKPPEDTAVPRIVGGGVVAFATMAVLSLMWWTLSPILGQIYAGIRLAETLVLWKFTGWGSYFTSMPAGQPFAFVSIYKSSVAFGVFATLVTLLIGFFAWRKRSREHIEVVNKATAGNPPAKNPMVDILGGAKRLARPTKASEEQEDTGRLLTPVPANPFATLRDLRDLRAVEVIADAVPWHFAGALALVLEACAPLQDEKARAAILAAAWKGSAHAVTNPGAEPPAAVAAALRSHMVVAIAEMRGRNVKTLDQLHAMLAKDAELSSTLDTLAKAAQSKGTLRFADYAWLRPVDTNLHTTICTL